MTINFKPTYEGFCQPVPASEDDTQKINEVLEKCCEIQSELWDASLYVNGTTLDFDTTVDVLEPVYDVLNSIDVVIVNA